MLPETVGRPMEILLIEDSVPHAKLAVGALRKAQFEHRLTWLRDGQEAADFLNQRSVFLRAPRPDLILLDLGLPEKDGRQILLEARANSSLRSIPVVIMTASTSDTDKRESEKLDVEGYLVKPVDLNKFLKLIRKLKHLWKEDMILPTGWQSRSDGDLAAMPIQIP